MTTNFAIPNTQKAQVLREVGLDPTLKEVPVPEPKDDELLVNILYSGLCHTDIHLMKNAYGEKLPITLPVIAGHEGVGIVVKLGKTVSTFKEGDRVGITLLHRTCQNCELCRNSHKEAFCSQAEYVSVNVPGTFRQHATVAAALASRIPDGVNLAKVAPIQCAGWTVYRALKETDTNPGQYVAITGAGGGLGTYALQYAKAMGLRPIAIDFGEAKYEHCLKQGAEFFIDAQKLDVIQEIHRITDGLGPHAVVNLAPSYKAIEDALQYVRKTGTIVMVGFPEGGRLEVDAFPFIMKGIRLKGSMLGSRQDMVDALDFVERGLVDVPVEIVGLSELADAAKRLDKGLVKGRIVLDKSK